MGQTKTHPSKVAVLYLIRKVEPATGAVFWVLRYRDGVGRSVAMDLGRQPVISRRQALKLTGDCRFKRMRIAPARPPRALGRQGNTVAGIVDRYLEYHAKPNSKSWAYTKHILDRDVLPVWGSRAIDSIQRQEVHDLMDTIIDRGAPMMANRVLRAIRSVWNWGIDHGYIESSPLNGMKPPVRDIPRDRVLKDEELLAIWRALDSFSWQFSSLVKLLLFTAQRRTEVAAAHWSEFNLRDRLWSIPRERMKAAAAHDVPLMEDVIEILRHLPRGPGSDYLFPATRGDGYNVAFKKAKSRLVDASGVTGWVLHDFRRTAATRLQALGFRLEVIEDVLGHVSGSRRGVVGVYQRHRFKDEKRDALEAWAQYLRHVLRPAKPPATLFTLRIPDRLD